MKDAHLHTNISVDGISPIRDYIKAAPAHGVDEMTFTEHWDDYTGMVTEFSTLDVESYHQAFLAAQAHSDLPIHFGIEMGLQPDIVEMVREIASSYPFDFIIGSSHTTCRIDLAQDPRFFEGLTQVGAYRRYFTEMLKNVAVHDDFDVYGHIDYIIRYGGYPEKRLDYADVADLLDEILKTLIRKDKGIELNTSGLRYGLGAAHPSLTILKRYRELGGKIITIGSDAHKTEHLGSFFKEGVAILEEAGFREISYFRNRKPDFMTLHEFLK